MTHLDAVARELLLASVLAKEVPPDVGGTCDGEDEARLAREVIEHVRNERPAALRALLGLFLARRLGLGVDVERRERDKRLGGHMGTTSTTSSRRRGRRKRGIGGGGLARGDGVVEKRGERRLDVRRRPGSAGDGPLTSLGPSVGRPLGRRGGGVEQARTEGESTERKPTSSGGEDRGATSGGGEPAGEGRPGEGSDGRHRGGTEGWRAATARSGGSVTGAGWWLTSSTSMQRSRLGCLASAVSPSRAVWVVRPWLARARKMSASRRAPARASRAQGQRPPASLCPSPCSRRHVVHSRLPSHCRNHVRPRGIRHIGLSSSKLTSSPGLPCSLLRVLGLSLASRPLYRRITPHVFHSAGSRTPTQLTLQPLPLLAVLNHHTRRPSPSQPRVIGALLGRRTDAGEVVVTNAFPVVHDEAKNFLAEREFREMREAYRKVSGDKEGLVGWSVAALSFLGFPLAL